MILSNDFVSVVWSAERVLLSNEENCKYLKIGKYKIILKPFNFEANILQNK